MLPSSERSGELKKLVFAVVATLSATACSTTGLGVSREALPASLQPLHDRANGGDKQALLQLGVAYAEGQLVERDCEQSRRLLRRAATATGGTLWVYSPPVGNGTTGRVIPIDQGPRQPGLQSAKDLLADPTFCEVGVTAAQ